jgi:tetratricopeptide (TPR) repeat protein
MKKILFTYLLLTVFIGFAQNNRDEFSKANELYKKGDYQKAIEQYEKLLQNNEESAEVYYNLANSYYKLNRIAPSIFYYEKALQINPDDEDITNNLELANQQIIDKPKKVPETTIIQLKKKINRFFSSDNWAILTIIWALLGLISFGIFIYSTNIKYKRLTFLSLFISLFLFVFSWYNANYAQKLSFDKYAIIFSDNIDAVTEPNLTAEKIITLHEGVKIQVLREIDNWYEIKLPNGKKAWVPNEAINLIN